MPALCNPYANSTCCLDYRCVPKEFVQYGDCNPYSAVIEEEEGEFHVQNSYSPYNTAITLYPLMFGLIEDEERLQSTLTMLYNDRLLSHKGIRITSNSLFEDIGATSETALI